MSACFAFSGETFQHVLIIITFRLPICVFTQKGALKRGVRVHTAQGPHIQFGRKKETTQCDSRIYKTESERVATKFMLYDVLSKQV